MARKFKIKDCSDIEKIVEDSLKRSGISATDKQQVALLTRLIFSGVANYFYQNPDNITRIGYLQLKKNPEKDQLFAMDIIRNEKEGILDANTLWRYYKGELASEAKLKEIIDKFIQDLLQYSQNQEEDIINLTKKLQ